jgi:hypothetical protein
MNGPERGSSSLWIAVGILVVAGLACAVPLVMTTRQEAGVANQAVRTDPSSAVSQANDVQAQVLLQTAIRSAAVFYAENGTLTGFGPQAASQYDPSIRYTTGAASGGVVSIRGLTPTSVVMVTATGSGFLCVAQNGDVTSFGRTDARSAAQCAGGWE